MTKSVTSQIRHLSGFLKASVLLLLKQNLLCSSAAKALTMWICGMGQTAGSTEVPRAHKGKARIRSPSLRLSHLPTSVFVVSKGNVCDLLRIWKLLIGELQMKGLLIHVPL